MNSIIKYIKENFQEFLGGENPYKIKDSIYLKFPINYKMKLTLKQFSLYINQLDIHNSEYNLYIGDKIYNFNDKSITKDILDIQSSYYGITDDVYNNNIDEIDLLLNDKDLNIKVNKFIPQGLLRNLSVKNVIDMNSYLCLRKILSNIDSSFSLWQNAIDKKNNTTNKAELLFKDLLNKYSGIKEITFILNFNINYTLRLKPIYFKGNKKEISRFIIEKIESTPRLNDLSNTKTNDNTIALNIYNIKKEVIDKCKNNNIDFNLNQLIIDKKIKINNSLIGYISDNNYSLNNFINHFKVNKFDVKDKFKEIYLKLIQQNKEF